MTRAVCADDHVYAAIGARPIEVTADDVAWHVESIASTIAKTFEEIEIWQDGLLDTERVVDAICDFLILLLYGFVLLTQLLSLPVDLTFEHLLLVAKDTLFLSVSFAFEERKSNYCGKENRYGDEDPHLPLCAEEARPLLVLDLFVLQLIDIHDGLHILDLAGVPLAVYAIHERHDMRGEWVLIGVKSSAWVARSLVFMTDISFPCKPNS